MIGGFSFGAGRASKKASSWTPANASVTLRAWYRPDLGLTESGGLVSAWLDQSGAGDANRDQSAAGADRPGYSASDAAYGNKPVVTGDGTQRMLSAGAWTWAPNPAFTIVIVGNTAASTAFLGDSTTNNMMYANGTPNEATYGTVAGALVGTGTPSSACVYMMTDDGTGGGSAAKLYVTNLGTSTTTGVTNWNSATRIDLLSDYGGGFGKLNGKLAEVIVWGGVISAGDKSDLVNYLNVTRAYGLGVT